MKVTFELKEIRQSWNNPLEPKQITTREVIAQELQSFDRTEKGEPLFKVLKIEADKALIEYNRDYTMKGYAQPMNRNVWIESSERVEFSSLWNSNGLTKKLTVKSIGVM